jgi:hypothetical protein
METSGNPVITSALRGGGDLLNTPDPRRCWALALLLLGRPRKAPQERLEAVRFPSRTTKKQTARRVMVRFKVRADQAATSEGGRV